MSTRAESAPSIKVINDPIHGTIALHKFAQLIIDTSEFQRLRHLKQLGLTYLVYPSATHTRFEHSIGTYHLAWTLAKKLQQQLKNDPEAPQLTDDEVLCVALAGLCHDLGHGPFSHLWEKIVKEHNSKYNHENMSRNLLKRIVNKIKISGQTNSEAVKEFKEFMERKNPDFKFSSAVETARKRKHGELQISNEELIELLVTGRCVDDEQRERAVTIPPKKQFLCEIVNNKRTGFDVDKWDYINRDSYYLGLSSRFDFLRQLDLLRVMKMPESDKYLLVIRDKEVLEYIQLMVARRLNHYVAYRHKKVASFEKLLEDAVLEAREHFASAEAPDTVTSKIFNNPDKVESLVSLTDERLVELLLNGSCGEKAANLMKQLEERKTFVHRSSWQLALHRGEDKGSFEENLKTAKEKIKEFNKSHGKQAFATLQMFNYSSEKKDPLSEMYCYTKEGGIKCLDENESPFSDLLMAAQSVAFVRLYGSDVAGDFKVGMEELGFKEIAE